MLIPWTRVRGQVGAREDRHDLVLAIDVSESTLVDSGYDADGDGRFPVARTSSARVRALGLDDDDPLAKRLREMDLEDSVLMAQIEGAELLLQRVDLGTTRVGIVLFSAEAEILSELSSDRRELDSALARARLEFPEMLGGTSFSAALDTSLGLLRGATGSRSIVVLSDGSPSLPENPYRAYQAAMRAVRLARKRGVRIFAFAIGPEAISRIDVYTEMTSATDGGVERVALPAEIVPRLAALDLVGLRTIAVSNRTNREDAIALRQYPNGSFDGFLALSVGENTLHFAAELSDGESVEVHRRVTRRDPASLTPEQAELARRQLAELLEELRIRSAKLALWAEMERARRGRVEVEALPAEESAPR